MFTQYLKALMLIVSGCGAVAVLVFFFFNNYVHQFISSAIDGQ